MSVVSVNTLLFTTKERVEERMKGEISEYQKLSSGAKDDAIGYIMGTLLPELQARVLGTWRASCFVLILWLGVMVLWRAEAARAAAAEAAAKAAAAEAAAKAAAGSDGPSSAAGAGARGSLMCYLLLSCGPPFIASFKVAAGEFNIHCRAWVCIAYDHFGHIERVFMSCCIISMRRKLRNLDVLA
jgi:hypothetical protein